MKHCAMAVVLLLALCTTGANAAVKIRYLSGQPTFVSAQPGSVVELAAPEATKARRIGLGVAVFNNGQQPITLGYENVSVRTSAGAPVPLITYEQLQHQAKVRAGWATFFGALAAGLNSYGASREGYGRVGNITFDSPIARQYALDRADAQNAALFTSISQRLDATLANLNASVLRTTTIDPGTTFGGLVAFDLPKGLTLRDLIITVSFGGDTHEITMDPNARFEAASSADLRPSIPAQATAMPIAPPAQAAATPTFVAAPAPAAPPQPPPAARVAEASPTAKTAKAAARSPRTYCIKVLSDPSQNNC